MKRKGRQSLNKNEDKPENGVEDVEENGTANDEPEEKKKRASKSKRDESTEETDNDEDSSDKKKRGKGRPSKSAGRNSSKKDVSDESTEEQEEDDKKKKRGRDKQSKSSKNDSTDESEVEDDVKNKKGKGKKEKLSKTEESEEEIEEDYEVEKVIGEKILKGVKHFLIRWKGYEPESDTWEPESTLDCAELIAEFKAQAKKDKGKKKKKEKKKTADDDGEASWDENEDFEVSKILDVYFKKDGSREFLVSWKGYPAADNSWEPESNLACNDLIKRYMSKVDKARDVDSKDLRQNRKHTDRFTLSAQASARRLSKRQLGKQRMTYHDAE